MHRCISFINVTKQSTNMHTRKGVRYCTKFSKVVAMSQVQIRKSRQDEIETLTEMWTEFMKYHQELREWRYELTDQAFSEIRSRFTQYIQDHDKLVLFVEDQDSSSPTGAGFSVARIETREPVFSSGKQSRITDFYLRKPYRGQQIGTTLFRRVQDWSREKDAKRIVTSIDTNNKQGVKFWEQLGLSSSSTTLFKEIESHE